MTDIVLRARELIESGFPDEAVELLTRAESEKPNDRDISHTLGEALAAAGLALGRRGEIDAALARFDLAAARDPAAAGPWHARGAALRAAGRETEAIAAFHEGIARDSHHAGLLNDLGALLASRGELEEGRARLEEALAARPDHVPAMVNLASVYLLSLRLEEARTLYDRALALRPGDPDTRFLRAQLVLLEGDLAAGWEDFEARLHTREGRSPARRCHARPWRGEDLDGRSIWVYPEAGIGDSIQFVRYVPLLIQRGASVILEAPLALRRLFEGLAGVRVVPPRPSPPPVDYHASLLSLPRGFGTRAETIPADVPYLTAPPAEVERWRSRLRDLGHPRVGICWAGNPANRMDRWRSIPPELLAPLGRLEGVHLVNLQLPHAAPYPLPFEEGIEEGSDLATTAGLLAQLDLVVTVDTAVAHLAGALGRPVWNLIAFSPDWRWQLARPDSPWYPAMRLFRQARPGDWSAVLEDVSRELAAAI